MARRTIRRHPTHQYVKAKLKPSGRIIYRCVIPGCTHYLFEEVVAGQQSICNRCEKEFVLTKAAMKRSKPHCLECTRGREREGPKVTDVLTNLNDLLKGL